MDPGDLPFDAAGSPHRCPLRRVSSLQVSVCAQVRVNESVFGYAYQGV